MTARFLDYCHRKEGAALATSLSGLITREPPPAAGPPMIALGNEWTDALFDGQFLRSPANTPDLPAVNLTFVQSHDGNTGADDPSTLGGGETDKHLIYEGLSRVDADAVLAGATTASGEDLVFSVWHPQLVALRRARGHGRHPAQVIVTSRAALPFDRALMFNEPGLRVFAIAPTPAAASLHGRLAGRPWIQIIDAGEPLSLRGALRQLRSAGIGTISAVGGRRTATTLLEEQLVDDLYLTTAPVNGGEPGTPFYSGPPLTLARVLVKEGRGVESGVRFEHLRVLRR